MIVELPYPPRALHPNERKSWRARIKPKKDYRSSAAELAAVVRIEHGCKPLQQATLRLDFYHPRNRKHDPDNLIAWAKTAIDALQDARLLANDRDVVYLPPRQLLDRDRPRLEVAIEAITGSL